MHTFKDGNGVEWSVHLTVGVLERVRRLAGVDLMEVATGDLWQRLVDDPVLLVKVLGAAIGVERSSRPLRLATLSPIRCEAPSPTPPPLRETQLDGAPSGSSPAASALSPATTP